MKNQTGRFYCRVKGCVRESERARGGSGWELEREERWRERLMRGRDRERWEGGNDRANREICERQRGPLL